MRVCADVSKVPTKPGDSRLQPAGLGLRLNLIQHFEQLANPVYWITRA